MSDNIGTILSELIGAAHRLSRLAARETGETTSAVAYSALGVLLESGPQRVGELAALCRVTQPGMTKVIAGLEESGWVERVADPLDARASVITITEAGVAARARRLSVIGAAVEPHFAGLGPDDLAALRRAAAILSERMDAASPATPTAE